MFEFMANRVGVVACLFSLAILMPPRAADVGNPCVIHAESLDYPEVLRAARLFGKVILSVRIDETGHVNSVKQVAGSDALAMEAVRNLRTWVFAPGEPTTLEIQYDFRLDPPGTREKVTPKVVFDLPSHVLVISRERETEMQ